MGSSLYELSNQYLQLFELAGESEDQQAFLDTMERIDGEFAQKCENICKVIVGLRAQHDGLKSEIERLQAKKKVIENNIDRLKYYMYHHMQIVGATKLTAGTFNLAIQKSTPALKIADETKVPETFIRHVPVVDKAAIKEALANGQTVEGCELVQDTHLRIR